MRFLKKLNSLLYLKTVMKMTGISNNVNDSIKLDVITHKDTEFLTNFLSEQGKILPRHATRLTPKQQRRVAKLIKTARIFTVLPFVKGKG